MDKALVLKLASALGFVALLLGCANLPKREMDMAWAALDEAKKVEADRYAQTFYFAAEDSLHAATAEIKYQESRLALFQNCGRAINLLISTTTTAHHAAVTARVQKENVRAATHEFLAQAHGAVDTSKALLQNARENKNRRTTRFPAD